MTEYDFTVENLRLFEQFNTGKLTIAQHSIAVRNLIKEYIVRNL